MRIVSVPPRRSKVRSCSTRRSLPCVAGSKRRDFVENNRAAAAQLEAAQLALHGAGEGAAFVAEKFALHQLRRQAGTINFQEWRVAARAEFVYRGARDNPCRCRFRR